jgi:hypothetical protein
VRETARLTYTQPRCRANTNGALTKTARRRFCENCAGVDLLRPVNEIGWLVTVTSGNAAGGSTPNRAPSLKRDCKEARSRMTRRYSARPLPSKVRTQQKSTRGLFRVGLQASVSLNQFSHSDVLVQSSVLRLLQAELERRTRDRSRRNVRTGVRATWLQHPRNRGVRDGRLHENLQQHPDFDGVG